MEVLNWLNNILKLIVLIEVVIFLIQKLFVHVVVKIMMFKNFHFFNLVMNITLWVWLILHFFDLLNF